MNEMKRMILIGLSVSTLSLYSGCTRTVYVDKECPRIKIYDVGDIKQIDVSYEVYEVEE